MSEKKQPKKAAAPKAAHPVKKAAAGAGVAAKPASKAKPPTKPADSILDDISDIPEKPKTGKMSDRGILVAAIEKFLAANSNFESSVALTNVMKDVEECKTLNEVFIAALKNKALTMDGALRFMLFLELATKEPLKDEDNGEEDPAIPAECAFVSGEALKLIETCYDNGVQEAVWDHVDAALEGEESDDEAEGDDAEPAETIVE